MLELRAELKTLAVLNVNVELELIDEIKMVSELKREVVHSYDIYSFLTYALGKLIS